MSVCFRSRETERGKVSNGESKSPQRSLSCEGESPQGKRQMQSSSPRPGVIYYLAIDPWVSGFLAGPPSHIHQAWSLQLKPEWRCLDRTLSSACCLDTTQTPISVKSRLNLEGPHYAPGSLEILACVTFCVCYYLDASRTWS